MGADVCDQAEHLAEMGHSADQYQDMLREICSEGGHGTNTRPDCRPKGKIGLKHPRL